MGNEGREARYPSLLPPSRLCEICDYNTKIMSFLLCENEFNIYDHPPRIPPGSAPDWNRYKLMIPHIYIGASMRQDLSLAMYNAMQVRGFVAKATICPIKIRGAIALFTSIS
jgi:hypothetical protein